MNKLLIFLITGIILIGLASAEWYNTEPLSTGLIYSWPFNESLGVSLVDRINGINMTNKGNFSWINDSDWSPKYTALQANNSISGRIETNIPLEPSKINLSLADSGGVTFATFCFVANITGNGTNQQWLFGKNRNLTDVWRFFLDENSIKFHPSDAGEYNIFANFTNSSYNHNWLPYCFVFNSTTNLSLYINSNLISSTAISHTPREENVTFYLGSQIQASASILNFKGGMREFSIWNRTLSASEINNWGLAVYNKVFLENSQTYNAASTVGESETFILNITYNSSKYTSIAANLHYNNSNYTGTIYGSGDDTRFEKTLTIPNGASGSQNFYWAISFSNASQVIYLNSSTKNQVIGGVILSICNYTTHNITFINFTIKDWSTKNIINGSFKSTFSTSYYNYTYENLSQSVNNYPFCFTPSYRNISINAIIEYERTDYAKNYYYLRNYQLTNVSTNIDLYLLNDSLATLTQLEVKDTSQISQPDIYIQIQSYDVGTDTYYTCAMAKTDFNGQDLAYLNWYDTYYRYILSDRDGNVRLMTGTSKISDTPVTFQISSIIESVYRKFDNIIYSLTFNNVTNNFILTFAMPSGDVKAGCLRVEKRTSFNDTIICDTCETSSSATIYCNIDAYSNGTYVGKFYATGSFDPVDTLIAFKGAVNQIYDEIGNKDGTMYAILFGLVILGGFLITPILAIVGTILALLGAMMLGFQPLNYMEFLGIVIIGGIIVLIFNK